MAELFGKATGYSQGKGGTQHMADFSLGFLGMNGITGGMLPIAAGAAFSAKQRGSGQVALAFFGDGASNQGTFHETLNMAAIWQLPVIFFCENNCYAMSTPANCSVSVADIAQRAAGYGLPGILVDGNDVLAVQECVTEAAARARAGHGATLIEAKTYRFSGHSRGDQRIYRTREEELAWANRDPIANFSNWLLAQGELTQDGFAQLRTEAEVMVADAEQFARESDIIDTD
jgi:pyruvate dehydrogenase E1 component alpha subunit